MSKLTRILLIIGLFDVAFIATMIYMYILTGSEMETLTTCVLGASGVEAVVSAIIKVANINKERKPNEPPIRAGEITGFDDAEIVDQTSSEVQG